MAIRLIGKSVLGDLGFCQIPEKMGESYYSQLDKVRSCLPYEKKVIMTSMTGTREVEATNGEYFPKIRKYDPALSDMFSPEKIYQNCEDGLDPVRPGADFVVWDDEEDITAATFSREAPILYFVSTTGMRALGVIMRKSLMKYGDYLFSTIKEFLGSDDADISVFLISCNHFEYPEGSIPSIVTHLASNHEMYSTTVYDSESHSECYHRGEEGNHVVAIC